MNFMKHTICYVTLTIFCTLVYGPVWAAGPAPETVGASLPETLQILQNKAEHIVRKCVAKAMLIREERVCESKKSAITACLVEEIKTKDMDKALQVCERNYIL